MAFTKGRAINTASAPRANALNTSTPVRMPPSTRILQRPLTASAISGRTSAVAGTWSRTRPPWLEITIAEAPASTAFCAPRAVMTPLMMNGTLASAIMPRSSSTVLLPAGGFRFFKNGRPAASMSMATANAPVARTRAIFSAIVPASQGFTVGMPNPALAFTALQAPTITAGLVPSPVKARIPASWQAGTRISLYSRSVYLVP